MDAPRQLKPIESRARHSAKRKRNAAMATAVLIEGATVASVARQHGIKRQSAAEIIDKYRKHYARSGFLIIGGVKPCSKEPPLTVGHVEGSGIEAAATREPCSKEPPLTVGHVRAYSATGKELAEHMASWSAQLTIPHGISAGGKFALHDFQRQFIAGAFKPGVAEAAWTMARKNAKSSTIAVLLLYLMTHRPPGEFRAVVASLDAKLAAELLTQMIEIAELEANEDFFEGFHHVRNPHGRATINSNVTDFFAAKPDTGQGIGANLAVIDEAGLLPERSREMYDAMTSCVSARAGVFLAISIQGTGPMFREMRDRAHLPSVYVQSHIGDPNLPLDDETNWRAANPGLGVGIKSYDYMRAAAAKALASPFSQANFRAFELNLPQDPSQSMIVSPDCWRSCTVPIEELPPRTGPCFLGVDVGAAASMSCVVAYWPESYRMEVWGALPSEPDLIQRGETDGCGRRYQEMANARELVIYSGHITNNGRFLADIADSLRDSEIRQVGSDRFKKKDTYGPLADAGIAWNMIWRGTGRGTTADGSYDVRAFQRLAMDGKIKCAPSLLMIDAISNAEIDLDERGNPALSKKKHRGRIDGLQAAVIACGLGEQAMIQPHGGGDFSFIDENGKLVHGRDLVAAAP